MLFLHGGIVGWVLVHHKHHPYLRGKHPDSLQFGLIFLNRFNSRVYVAYSVFYILGTLFAIQVVARNSSVDPIRGLLGNSER